MMIAPQQANSNVVQCSSHPHPPRPLLPPKREKGSQAEKASRTLFAWLTQRNEDARVIWRTGGLETDFVNHVEIRLNGRTMAPCTKRTECKPTEASVSQISRQCTNADGVAIATESEYFRLMRLHRL